MSSPQIISFKYPIQRTDETQREEIDASRTGDGLIDRGSEFGAHRARDNPDWESEFKAHVNAYGTKVILIRKKHPQSNGKIERWFETYQMHRAAFASFEEFVNWYNDRPHGSLDFESIETPNEAFWRRLPPENLLGNASWMFGW